MDQTLERTTKITLQPVRNGDYEEVADVLNASERAMVGHDLVTPSDLENDLNAFGANPETDTRVVRDAAGKIIAYADCWPGVSPHVRMYGFLRIHPDHRNEGAGTALTQWIESRAAEWLALSPAEFKVTLGQNAYARQTRAKTFLESCGYVHLRSSFRMTIDLSADIPQPVFPSDLTVETIGRDDTDLRQVLAAQKEAFLDHYGVIDEPFEDYYKRTSTHLLADENIDFSACYKVMDGAEVAAVCINQVSIAGHADSGWVSNLSVRRPWRQQGIGLALLHKTFREMQQRGRQAVGLYVDAENLTGALRLYQAAGMHVEYESCYFEKVLREGIDLAKKA